MKHRHRYRGFTLIELMIAVAIVALIAAIAYPSYRDSVLRSRRSDAKVALTQTAQTLERCYSQFASYDASSCPVQATTQSTTAITSPEGYYTVNVADTATTFTLTATPTTKGGQDDDTTCHSFTLTETGKRGSTSQAGSDTTSTCW